MNFKRSKFLKTVALFVSISVLIVTGIPRSGLAYVVGMDGISTSTRAADMAAIQRVLETKLIREKLSSLGLSADEIDARLAALSDSELHSFADQLDSLYPGGDALSVIAGILIIVILVLVIFKLTGHKIIIK